MSYNMSQTSIYIINILEHLMIKIRMRNDKIAL